LLVDVAYYLTFALVLLSFWSACAFFAGGWFSLRAPAGAGTGLSDGGAAWTRSGRLSLWAVFGVSTFCSVVVVRSMFEQDYSVAYVSQVSDRALPFWYKFSAFWASMDGSMLLWLFMLAGFGACAIQSVWKKHRELTPWAGMVLALTCLFWAGLIAFDTNPFERLDFVPEDGRGMNPALQNYWMAIHPPTLYLGYTGLAVPFAFAVAALVTGRLDLEWVRVVRTWMLAPWMFLGIGMIFGARWAYEEIGWGGYWAWDPVENASLMPWLLATAYLHSVMIQERRGLFRMWNLILVIGTFVLSMLGTFITRSGVVESVHSFARSSTSPWFLGFVVLTVALAVGLIFYRWPELKSPQRIDSMVSREFSFMLNNLGFVAITLAVLVMTLWAPISELVTGDRFVLGPPAFNASIGPLAVVLLFLTGIGPLIAWRKASARSLRRAFLAPTVAALVTGAVLFAAGLREPMAVGCWAGSVFTAWCVISEFHRGARVVGANRGLGYLGGLAQLIARNRRRYGGYVVHLSVVLFFLGVAGMLYDEKAEVVLRPGDSASIHGYELTYTEPVPFRGPGSDVYSVNLAVSKDGKPVTDLRPEFKIHDKFPEPEKDVAIHSTMWGDLYAILGQPVDPRDPKAKLQFKWNPLVTWVWNAGWLMLIGTAICVWPDPPRRDSAAAGRRKAA
jgi:cytochrome c-type biogenesis protein CcmF